MGGLLLGLGLSGKPAKTEQDVETFIQQNKLGQPKIAKKEMTVKLLNENGEWRVVL